MYFDSKTLTKKVVTLENKFQTTYHNPQLEVIWTLIGCFTNWKLNCNHSIDCNLCFIFPNSNFRYLLLKTFLTLYINLNLDKVKLLKPYPKIVRHPKISNYHVWKSSWEFCICTNFSITRGMCMGASLALIYS
jgi:hypothetical protein